MNFRMYKQVAIIRKKSLLGLAVIFLLSTFVHLYTVTLQEKQLDRARTEWNDRRNAEKIGKSILSKEMIYKNGKLDLERLRQRIYSKEMFAKFLSELYETSSRNSLEITSISYKPELIKDDNLYKYSMTLTSSGKYVDQKKFIRDLGLINNLIHIDAISFANRENNPDIVQLQTQISAYFKLEAK